MDGITRPVGEEPASVYWRRRAIVIGVALLAIIGLFFLIQATFFSGGDGAAADPTSSATPSAAPSVTTDEGTVVSACADSDVTVTVTPTTFTWNNGTLPTFDVALVNTGLVPCSISVDETSELLITSGSDRIYNSADCNADGTFSATDLILQPEASPESIPITWVRQRSAEGCAEVSATPQPGYYNATVTIQGIASEPVQFELG